MLDTKTCSPFKDASDASKSLDIPALIIAGGKGTRLGYTDIPKPMVPVSGIPLLEHQIKLLRSQGVNQIHILAGFLAEKITAYFGDGKPWGVHITYHVETVPLGTAGAVAQAKGLFHSDFLVLYGDVYVDMDLHALYEHHKTWGGIATLTVHPNDHPQDSDLLELGDNWAIKKFHSKPHAAGIFHRNVVNAALYVFSNEVFSYLETDKPQDFGKDVFPAMLEKGARLVAYATPEYLKDMGTPERLCSVSQAITSGKTARRNKRNLQRAVFLDRDGIINVEKNGILNTEDFELTDDIVPALKSLHETDFLVIVVTNQPFIAKGQLSKDALEQIHACMDTLLGLAGTFVDGLYYCPHHPEKGWPGEVTELKIPCTCRKPMTGMLDAAARDFNIDLSKSFIIGDRISDGLTGVSAGLMGSFVVNSTEDLEPTIPGITPVVTLLEAVRQILAENI